MTLLAITNTDDDGGRTITNLRFADDVDGPVGEEELPKLVEHFDKASTASAWRSVPRRTR